MLGCGLKEVYPVVPLAAGHALSIGMSTLQGDACFGLYADREALPDAVRLAERIVTATLHPRDQHHRRTEHLPLQREANRWSDPARPTQPADAGIHDPLGAAGATGRLSRQPPVAYSS
jgi:hypothetical protein